MLFTVLSCVFNFLQYFPYLDHSLLPHSTMLFTVLSCVFNFLQYFPYLDHSLLPHSTMLFTVLSCMFNFLQYFPYLDHSLLPHSTMLFTVLSCVFNISHYFLLFRSLRVIHKGSTKHTSQLPTATEVWAGASGPQDEGSKRNQQPTVERRFHGEGTTVKDKN